MRLAPILLAASLLAITAHAQSLTPPPPTDFGAPNRLAVAPLPPNYKTILDNSDVLVQQVHFAAHELVPAFNQPAYATLFVSLTNSGEVNVLPTDANAITQHRAPTQAGDFRLAPAHAERHSIQSNSNTPTDFLRIEFKTLSLPSLANVPAFANADLRVDRITCAANTPCAPLAITHRTLLIALNPTSLTTNKNSTPLALGEVKWLTPDAHTTNTLSPGAHALLVTFLAAEAPRAAPFKPCTF